MARSESPMLKLDDTHTMIWTIRRWFRIKTLMLSSDSAVAAISIGVSPCDAVGSAAVIDKDILAT